MKKVFKYVPDMPQKSADRGTEIVERHLTAYGVSRAVDLPEEGKVRLARDLQGFFRAEIPEGLPMVDPREMGWRGWLRRTWRSLRASQS